MAANLTTLIANFPLVNQLNAPTVDGQPDEDRNDNCVAASNAAAWSSQLRRPFSPDALKDAVYGQGYTGFQAETHYVTYAAKLGIRLTPVNGTPAALLPIIHQQLAQRHPVIATIPSQWASPWNGNGYTHVICFAGAGPDVLRAMNPWGGFWQDEPDSWWGERLAFNQIWIVSLATEATPAMTTDNYTVVTGPDGTRWYKDTRTGHEIGGGIHAYAVAHNLPPCIAGEHKAPNGRDSYAVFGDPARGVCQDHNVYWDAKRGQAVEQWESVVVDLQAQYDALKAQLAAQAASAPAASASDEATHALNVVKAIKTQVAPF